MDAMAALLLVERIGPPAECEFACRVRAHAGAGHPPGGTRDVDDRARRGPPQQGEQRLGEPHLRIEVEVHGLGYIGPAGFGETPAPAGARIIHQDIEPSVALLEDRGDVARGLGGGQVRGGHRGTADLVCEGLESRLASGHEYQLGARHLREAAGGGGADPAARPGDEDDAWHLRSSLPAATPRAQEVLAATRRSGRPSSSRPPSARTRHLTRSRQTPRAAWRWFRLDHANTCLV